MRDMFRTGQDWTVRAFLDNVLALYESNEPVRARAMLRLAQTTEEIEAQRTQPKAQL